MGYLYLFLYYFLFSISMLASFTYFYSAINTPIGLMTVWNVIGGLVSFVLAIYFMSVGVYSFFQSVHKGMEKKCNKFLEKNGFTLDEKIVLRHEKFYDGKPKRLISITVSGTEIFTDVCHQFQITSDHEAFLFPEASEICPVILVVRNIKGGWKAYHHTETPI